MHRNIISNYYNQRTLITLQSTYIQALEWAVKDLFENSLRIRSDYGELHQILIHCAELDVHELFPDLCCESAKLGQDLIHNTDILELQGDCIWFMRRLIDDWHLKVSEKLAKRLVLIRRKVYTYSELKANG